MFTIPGTENLSPAVKYVIAFAIIFLLLALFALILRRLTGSRMSVSQERGRARQPRLGIVDVYDLDRQRQLILLRRDNVEHLLLVGGPNDVVVETNIVRVPGARLPASQPAEIAEKSEGGTPRGPEGGPARPIIENGFSRIDLPGSLSTQDGVASALEPMLKPTRVNPGASTPPPVQPAARPSVPRGAESPVPDMTKELEATLRRAQEQQGAPDMPQAPARPAPAPQPAPVASPPAPPKPAPVPPATPAQPPKPAPAPVPPAPAPAAPSPPPKPAPAPVPPSPAAPAQPPKPAPAPVPPAQPKPVPPPAPAPAAPSPPPKPAPAQPPKPAPAPVPPAQPQPVPPAPAAAQPKPAPVPPKPAPATAAPPAPPPPKPAPAPAPVPPAPPPAAAPPPPPPPPPKPAPAPAPVPPAPPPATAAPPPPKPAPAPVPPKPAPAPAPKPEEKPAPASADPFSIEDIEAEFARLLGRPLDKKD